MIYKMQGCPTTLHLEPMREISYDDPIREKFVNNDHQKYHPGP